MIIARLTGGLGNQMFEYAAARTVADRLDTELLLDTTWYETQSLRRYELDSFPRLRARPLTAEELDLLVSGEPTLIQMWGLWQTAHLTLPGFRLVLEVNPHFDPAALEAADNSYFVGYWQSEQYFRPAVTAIWNDFQLAAKPPRTQGLLGSIRTRTPVSVHVRRTDNVTNPKARDTLGTPEAGYYADASRAIQRAAGRKLQFFVFSDDPDWCRSELRLPGPTTIVDQKEGAAATLAMMSRCRHHVIANSTFSWWAAWLSPFADKVVVAPRRWARDPRYEGSRIPDAWIRI